MKKITLKGGQVALIDDKYYDLVKGDTWFMLGKKGVASRDGKQIILLHNMIAPFDRVSFKNGNKLDCRRENLIPWVWKPRDRLPTAREVYRVQDGRKFLYMEFRRKVTVCGEVFHYIVSRSLECVQLKANIRKEYFNFKKRSDFLHFLDQSVHFERELIRKEVNQIAAEINNLSPIQVKERVLHRQGETKSDKFETISSFTSIQQMSDTLLQYGVKQTEYTTI